VQIEEENGIYTQTDGTVPYISGSFQASESKDLVTSYYHLLVVRLV
jgi:hypothetical protein